MIGIIGAMEEEVAALKSEMADAKVTEFASMTFYKGTLCGKDAVVVRSGIGKVNAAMCAQILADIQIRIKHVPTQELVALAAPTVQFCKQQHIPCIINDDAEAAALLQADGVHVGQTAPFSKHVPS